MKRALLVSLAVVGLVAAGSVAAQAAPATAPDDAFTYSAGWNEVNSASSEHWSSVAGSTATINFTAGSGGSTFSLKSMRDPTNRTVGIKIDNGVEVSKSESGTTLYNYNVYTSPLLAAGAHTVRVRVITADGSITGASLSNGTFGTAPPPPPASTVPVGDLPGWHQTYADDFTTPATTAADFTSTYPRLFPYTDNSRYARSNITVANGTLNLNLRSDGVGAALVITAPSTGWGQTYGRYSVRFRADRVPTFGSAFLLWPDSEVWGDGETDYPEGNFDDQIHVYNHCVGANPQNNCLAVSTGASWQDWHVATIDWAPDAVTFYLDGVQIGRDTSAVATKGRHWVIQTAGGATTQPGALQIDWVALYERSA